MKVSTIFKSIILCCLTVFMGFFLAISNLDKGSVAVYQMIIAVIGIVMAIVSLLLLHTKGLSNENRKKLKIEYRKLNIFIIPYLFIIFYEILHTYSLYGYNRITMLYAVTPYLYVLFCYPLVYIFTLDKSYIPFIKKVAFLGFCMTVLRWLGWYFYNFRNSNIFSGLVLQSEDWLRNGLQRIDTVPLFGIILVVYAYRTLRESKNTNLLITIVMFMYPIIVTQVRYLSIVVVVTLIAILYLKPNIRKIDVIFRTFMSLFLVIVLLFGGIKSILSLFLENGQYDASTSIRFEAMGHYYNLILQTKNMFGGLGFLSFWNEKASLLMMKNEWQNYYLSDIGIVGGMITFGLLGIVVYGGLYYIAGKTSISSFNFSKDKWDQVILCGLFIYLVLSCISLNIFDMNRSMDVPFYIAIFCYNWKKRYVGYGLGED